MTCAHKRAWALVYFVYRYSEYLLTSKSICSTPELFNTTQEHRGLKNKTMSYPVKNPVKEVITNHSVSKIVDVIKELPKFATSATLTHENPTMNFFQYTAKGKGLFSTGMLIDITLHPISPDQTKIILEGRRMIGWIDNTVELSETENYLTGTLSMMGKGLRGELK